MGAEAESVRRTEEIPAWKRREVGEIIDFLERYDSVGVVSIAGIPSRQLQLMRADLRGDAALRVSRNSLLTRALDDVDEGLEQLGEEVWGQVGLIGTNDNPFGLFQQLEASKTPAPINAGETAPNDIVIAAGDTGIDPGPFVGELQQVGAEARIQEGSIHVTTDSTVAEEGEVVSETLAAVLDELAIEPKEVGLDLRVVYSDGILFEADDLALDVDAYRSDVQAGIGAATTLAMEANFPTPATIATLLQRGQQAGRSLGLSAGIEDPAVLPDLLRRADAAGASVAGRIDDDEARPADVPTPDASTAQETDATEATPDDEPDADTDESESQTAEDGDDEDGDGAEGLGEMFG